MRLVDLEPRWLSIDGRRVGFLFKCPTKPGWWQSCFAEVVQFKVQNELFEAIFDGDRHMVQGCEQIAWNIAGGIENATFETMTVTPSLDGSKGGLWHGFITGGQIV